MPRHTGNALAAALVSLMVTGSGATLAGEPARGDLATPVIDVARTIPCEKLDDDSSYPLGYDQTLELAVQVVQAGRAEAEKEDRKCFFRMGEALARHLVFEDPSDPEARYWYAAAMALRGAEEGGRTQVQLAQRAHTQALLTLTVAPDHAGAHHVLGRLHAAVMRLSSLKRFLATRVLGGGALSGASWETAEFHLAAASRLAPEVPSHPYELGALYLDTSRPELALAAFERVLACPQSNPADAALHAYAGDKVALLRHELRN